MQLIIVQKVSENQSDAAIGQWFAKEGQALKTGDLVVELITEKANFELEAEEDGILLRQCATAKSIVPIGFTVAIIGPAEAELPPDIEARNRELLAGDQIQINRVKEAQSAYGDKSGAIKATPAARRKARQAGIDLVDIRKELNITGILTEKDVKAFVDSRDA